MELNRSSFYESGHGSNGSERTGTEKKWDDPERCLASPPVARRPAFA